MRILAVDPGTVRIGLALSDPGGTLARPLQILKHEARQKDAELIAEIAAQNEVCRIVVGLATDPENRPNPQGRKAKRLAAAIREASGLEVELWDESFSSQEAEGDLIAVKGKASGTELDDLAAARILQSYLDARQELNRNAK